jgi:O-antigen ligase
MAPHDKGYIDLATASDSNLSAQQDRPSIAAGSILSTAAVVAPSAVYFGSKILPALAVVAAVSALVAVVARGASRPWRFGAMAIALGLIPIWAFVSALWAMDVQLAIQGAGKLLGSTMMIGVLLFVADNLNPREKLLVQWAVVIGFALLLIEAFIDALSGGAVGSALFGSIATRDGLSWVHSSAMMLSLMVWPLGVVMLRLGRFWVFGFLYALLIVLNWKISYGTGIVIVAASSVVAVATWYFTKPLLKLLMVGTACAVLTMPALVMLKPDASFFASQTWVSNSALHRLHIWDFATSKIVEHPLLGWGMNAARIVPGGKQGAIDTRGNHGELMPLHPHNAALQIWLELGVAGALTAAAFSLLFFLHLLRSNLDDREKSLIVGQAISLFVVLWAGFGIWQSWLLAATGLTSAWMLATVGNVYPKADA